MTSSCRYRRVASNIKGNKFHETHTSKKCTIAVSRSEVNHKKSIDEDRDINVLSQYG